MRAKFTKLLLYLHVDKHSMLEYMSVPVLTRIWSTVGEDMAHMPRRENIPALLEILKPFVRQYIESIIGMFKSYDKEGNEMTFAVLILTEALIKYGFYQT